MLKLNVLNWMLIHYFNRKSLKHDLIYADKCDWEPFYITDYLTALHRTAAHRYKILISSQ